jgi:hypothetical protein
MTALGPRGNLLIHANKKGFARLMRKSISMVGSPYF